MKIKRLTCWKAQTKCKIWADTSIINNASASTSACVALAITDTGTFKNDALLSATFLPHTNRKTLG